MTLPLTASAKQYPADIRRNINQNCVGLNKEMIVPCGCILKGLEKNIPYEVLEPMIIKGTAMQDPRVQAIARQCSKLR